jgi:hypothetical protein
VVYAVADALSALGVASISQPRNLARIVAAVEAASAGEASAITA